MAKSPRTALKRGKCPPREFEAELFALIRLLGALTDEQAGEGDAEPAGGISEPVQLILDAQQKRRVVAIDLSRTGRRIAKLADNADHL